MSWNPARAPSAAQPATCTVSAMPAMTRSPAVSLAAAGLAAGCVLVASGAPGLPVLAAALFLFLVVENDVRRLRIPNWLTLPTLVLALAAQLATGGLTGLGEGALGALAGLGLLVLPYAGGFLGAGDVKAAMALGALWGGGALVTVLIWSGLVGGLLGIPLLVASGGLGDLVSRWKRGLIASLVIRRFVWIPPAPGSVAARVLPFGAVLALGAAATLAWGAPWA